MKWSTSGPIASIRATIIPTSSFRSLRRLPQGRWNAASRFAVAEAAPRSVRTRFRGAGPVQDHYSAHQGVEHDDMNILCMGGRVVGPEVARDLVDAFLAAEFSKGERNVRRPRKVAAL